jgi:hypothetical protein
MQGKEMYSQLACYDCLKLTNQTLEDELNRLLQKQQLTTRHSIELTVYQATMMIKVNPLVFQSKSIFSPVMRGKLVVSQATKYKLVQDVI